LGGCPREDSTDIRMRFADAFASASKVFLSLTIRDRISAYTSRKRFLWGPHDVGSDSLHSTTVLSLPVVTFPMLGSIWHSTLYDSYRNVSTILPEEKFFSLQTGKYPEWQVYSGQGDTKNSSHLE
jgi:hypothetical protein